MKEWEKESFIALILIHAYPCPPGTTRLFIATHVFWSGTASNDVSSDETTKTNKQTNKPLKKQTWLNPRNLTGAVTQPQWRDGGDWDSYSSFVIKYTTFSLGYFHSSLFFFIFKDVAQYNRLNFISSCGRKQPPNNGRRTGGEKWVSSHRWEKATGKDLVIVILYCLLIKYILILVYYLLDHFDWKVLGIH